MSLGLIADIQRFNPLEYFGKVLAVKGPVLHVSGLADIVSLGDLVRIQTRQGREFMGEVVSFEQEITLVMPYAPLDGIGPDCLVTTTQEQGCVYPSHDWLGRVINGFAEPMDGLDFLPSGEKAYPLNADPISAHQRDMVEERLDLGVKALNTFTTCCKGQRMGIFAGSGVGKSVLMSQLARFSKAEVIVIGLIGERGREVREFIEKYLGPEGLARSVVIVSTSDEPALLRRRAAYTTLAVAEYFRDQGKQVLCLMDSVTRFAMALREIGLATGQPPTTKGYTPNVFSELPRLLERAGPGRRGQSSITGLFTVLVEGDDTSEPIADTVRSILDGHIVLERKIAERGRYPAINVLKSISRTMPDCNTPEETQALQKARQYMATYEDMEELIRLGAYRKGSNAEVDDAIAYSTKLYEFLSQSKDGYTTLEDSMSQLRQLINSSASSLESLVAS